MKIGDAVSWVKTSRSGTTISMEQKEGVIADIADDVATIKYGRNNRRAQVHVSRLRLQSEPGQLTEVAKAMASIYRKEE